MGKRIKHPVSAEPYSLNVCTSSSTADPGNLVPTDAEAYAPVSTPAKFNLT
jgi:hypothetical protein